MAITPGPPGAVGGGATLPAGTTGLLGTGGGAILAARRTTRMPAPRPPGAVEGAGGTVGAVDGSAALAPRSGFAGAGAPGAAEGTGGTIGAGTTGSPAAGTSGAAEDGGAILMARALGLRAAGPPRALNIVVAATTIGLSGTGPPGGVEDGGGGIMAAGNIELAGACGGGGGINTGGIGPFRRRSGIAAGFAMGGATLPSVPGFELCAISFRRRFGMEAATGGVFAFPRRGAAFMVSSGGNGLPRRGTPRGSSQIHFTAPLPPSVRMNLFLSRRCISSITQRFEKPVSSARRSISIWRPPRLADSGLGDASN
jgi:hypothetical protein